MNTTEIDDIKYEIKCRCGKIMHWWKWRKVGLMWNKDKYDNIYSVYPPTPEPLDLSPSTPYKSKNPWLAELGCHFVTPELQGEPLTTDMKISVAVLVYTVMYIATTSWSTDWWSVTSWSTDWWSVTSWSTDWWSVTWPHNHIYKWTRWCEHIADRAIPDQIGYIQIQLTVPTWQKRGSNKSFQTL